MAFNYQNDIDSKMENYPLKLHNTLTCITAKFGKENYEYIRNIVIAGTILGAIDAAARVPHPPSNQYKSTCYYIADHEYIAETYKMIDKCIKFPPRICRP